jgi:MFS family permease
MSKKQLYVLFVCSLIPWTVGNGLLPLLPVFASQLGATPALVGYYLSFSYLALAIGTLVAGWLADKFQNRQRLLIIAGALNILAIWLLGHVSNPWQLTALTSTVWFLGGISLTLIGILAGLFAEERERGKVFGVLALTSGLGALVGGLTIGAMADQWGYPTMFLILALFSGILPLAGLMLEDKLIVRRAEIGSVRKPVPFGRGFYFLVIASVVAGITLFVGYLGRSLAMRQLGFFSANIASTSAIGGLVTLPLSPLMGRLSDRIGRKMLLILCYVAGGLGLLILSISTTLWHFWLAVAFLSISSYVGSGIGSAFVTDLVPKASLGKGISTFNATSWVGGIIGFAAGGNAIETFGLKSTFITAACFLLLAIILLIPIRQMQHIDNS